MATTAQNKNLILPDYIRNVTQPNPRRPGKVKIPSYDELPKVRGIFKNIEVPGTGISFPFREWKGPVKNFTFMDGQEYIIPRLLADHLNDRCFYLTLKWVAPDGTISSGKPIAIGGSGFQTPFADSTKEIASKTSRFMFQILGDA